MIDPWVLRGQLDFRAQESIPQMASGSFTLTVLYFLTEMASSFILVIRFEIFMYRHLFISYVLYTYIHVILATI